MPSPCSSAPAFARIREDVDVNYACRNVFSRSGEALLHDRGDIWAALDAETGRDVRHGELSDEAALSADPELRRLLLEPIPLGEIGP